MYAEVLSIKTLNDRSEQGELEVRGTEGRSEDGGCAGGSCIGGCRRIGDRRDIGGYGFGRFFISHFGRGGMGMLS